MKLTPLGYFTPRIQSAPSIEGKSTTHAVQNPGAPSTLFAGQDTFVKQSSQTTKTSTVKAQPSNSNNPWESKTTQSPQEGTKENKKADFEGGKPIIERKAGKNIDLSGLILELRKKMDEVQKMKELLRQENLKQPSPKLVGLSYQASAQEQILQKKLDAALKQHGQKQPDQLRIHKPSGGKSR